MAERPPALLLDFRAALFVGTLFGREALAQIVSSEDQPVRFVLVAGLGTLLEPDSYGFHATNRWLEKQGSTTEPVEGFFERVREVIVSEILPAIDPAARAAFERAIKGRKTPTRRSGRADQGRGG